jgi:hypothetical protein
MRFLPVSAGYGIPKSQRESMPVPKLAALATMDHSQARRR